MAQYSEFRYKRKNHSTNEGYVMATHEARYLSGGIGLNLQGYVGDLTPNDNYFGNGIKVIRPGVAAFAAYNYNPILFFSGDLTYGRIVGDDFNADPYGKSTRKYVRNLSFRNDLIGLTLRANANVLRDPFEYYKRKNFNMYFFTGISFFYSNPKAKVPETDRNGTPFENAGEWVALRPLGTEGQNAPGNAKKYSSIQAGILLGGGLRFRLKHRIDLLVEGSLHYILSDYIDDIAGNYVDLGTFDDELAKALSDRSMEVTAVVKGDVRDQAIIEESTMLYTYESTYDGNTYTVFKNFGHDGGIRGGDRNDLIATMSIKISYIFTK
jgi:hypothetical protein